VRSLFTGLKSPASPGEGKGVYGKGRSDREFVKLADPFLTGNLFQKLLLYEW